MQRLTLEEHLNPGPYTNPGYYLPPIELDPPRPRLKPRPMRNWAAIDIVAMLNKRSITSIQTARK